VDASAVLASAEDRVIDEAVAALAQAGQAGRSPLPDGRRREVRQLFRLVLRCVRAGCAEPVIRPSEQIAAHCYAAGIDLAEIQGSFTVLAEVLWRQLAGALASEQLVKALGLLTAITGAGKDTMARTYLALATRDRGGGQPADEPAAAGAGSGDRPRCTVQAGIAGQVGIITLGDRDKRNAIGAEMASRVIAALGSLRARQGGCRSTSSRRCSSPRRPSTPAKPASGCSSTTWSRGTGSSRSPWSWPPPWPPSHRWP
jgi:hypothetical protein